MNQRGLGQMPYSRPNYLRNDATTILQEKGYDIGKTAKELQEWYVSKVATTEQDR